MRRFITGGVQHYNFSIIIDEDRVYLIFESNFGGYS
jgi:hypothetical protein